MAAINKNFVIKNGIEVGENLIYGDKANLKVGIGTTVPNYTLDVRGGIGATSISVGQTITANSGIFTSFNVSGVGNITTLNATGVAATVVSSTWSQVGLGLTFTTGIATNFTVSGVGTITQLVSTSANITGVGTIANLSSGIATVTKIHVGIATTYSETLVVSGNARVTGILTIGTGSITLNGNTDIITVGTGATIFSSGDVRLAGIITAYKFVGDGSALTGTINGVGIQSGGSNVSFGITTLNFAGGSIQSVTGDSNLGISTITIQAGAPTPAGSNTQIQFNNAGVGGASANLTFDGSNVRVSGALTATAVSSTWSQVGLGLTFTTGIATNFTVSGVATVTALNATGIYVSGITTSQDFDALSDMRYKTNVTTVNGALDKVKLLRGVKFDWKESGLSSYGVIAQELEEVLPEIVHGQNPKTVNYNAIIGILIEAIKELQNEMDRFKSYK